MAVLAALVVSLVPVAAQSSEPIVIDVGPLPPRPLRSGLPPGVPPAARKPEPKGEHRITVRLPPPPWPRAWDPDCRADACPAVPDGGMQ